MIIDDKCDINDNSDKNASVQILSTDQYETSVVLPSTCSFLTDVCCRIDDFTINGIKYRGEKSEPVKIGGSLQAWIDRHDS